MTKETMSKSFWNRYARFYDSEVLRFSRNAYEEMYRSMARQLTKDMDVLEIATGTGLIALNIAEYVHSIEATDYSPKMIETASKKQVPPNVHFSVEDATALSFAAGSFDAVVISNALHIMPSPERALAQIRRVLKPGGLLIAPNFTHGHLKESGKVFGFILRIVGFETYSKWTPEEYVAFISKHGFSIISWRVLDAAFPLAYVEAKVCSEELCLQETV